MSTSRTVVYFAHPLRGATPEETAANRAAASVLVARAAARYPIAPVCSWIVLSSQWSEEEGRALGLEIDCALVERCDELWLCGPARTLSDGMQIEHDHAAANGVHVRDLRGFRFDGTDPEAVFFDAPAPRLTWSERVAAVSRALLRDAPTVVSTLGAAADEED